MSAFFWFSLAVTACVFAFIVGHYRGCNCGCSSEWRRRYEDLRGEWV